MKVESPARHQNGLSEGHLGEQDLKEHHHSSNDKSKLDGDPVAEGTTTNGCVSGDNLSVNSVSEIDSGIDDEESITSEDGSDAESSELGDIVATNAEVCHAATLEAFLES